MPAHFDVAIVGAGPAGAATARRLALSGCRVVMIERSRFDAPRVGESLAPGVQPLLAELGVWPQLQALGPQPSYGTRSSWGGPDADEHSHLLTPYLHGWHIDRLAFDRLLAESAVQAGAQLQLGARVVCFEPAPHGAGSLSVACSDDPHRVDELSADFVVDAGGRGSALARWVGARHAVFDRLVGIAVHFDDAHAASNCYTLVETTPDGWWYSAPVTKRRSVGMLMTDADLLRSRKLCSLKTWRAALLPAPLTHARLSCGTPRWGPKLFSAVSQRLVRHDERASACWLAVGDAALAVDPISGSGVIRALRTASAAAQTVMRVLGTARSGPRDAVALADYEHDRDLECTRYLVERAGYYAAETRWRESAFWARRLVAAAARTNLQERAI